MDRIQKALDKAKGRQSVKQTEAVTANIEKGASSWLVEWWELLLRTLARTAFASVRLSGDASDPKVSFAECWMGWKVLPI